MTTNRRFTFDPFRELRELTQTFNTFGPTDDGGRSAFPALNIWENAESLFVEAEVPGFDMNNIEVFVEGPELKIKGHRELTRAENQTWHRRERISGEFSRRVQLPLEVDAERVEAKMQDGVLTIVLPKHERARARKITVKTA